MLSKVWNAGQKILDQFWLCRQKEYLTDFRQSSISSAKGAVQRKPSIDEVVLVRDESLPRERWKLAVAIQTHTSEDGLVRSATVRIPSGKRVRRPMSLLYPLQTQKPQQQPTVALITAEEPAVNDDQAHNGRPRRQAAQICNTFIQDWVNSDQV